MTTAPTRDPALPAPVPPRPRVCFDMDGVLVDFESGIARLTDVERERYAGRYDEVPGIFARMDPMPGAISAFRRLARLFDVLIVSTAPWENPSAWSDKAVFVREHLGDVARKRLVLTHRKDLVMGDYLIDDRTAHGAAAFGGRHLHFGSPAFPDWDTVLAFLLAEADRLGLEGAGER